MYATDTMSPGPMKREYFLSMPKRERGVAGMCDCGSGRARGRGSTSGLRLRGHGRLSLSSLADISESAWWKGRLRGIAGGHVDTVRETVD